MGNKLFGTDGVRGVANVYPMTADFAMKLAMAAGKLVCTENRRAAIARDTRISGDMLEAAMIAGFTSQGVDVVRLGVLPTPAATLLTPSLGVDMTVMITASHNPYYDNGIKLIDCYGEKMPEEILLRSETVRQIKKLLHELPDPYKEVFMWRVLGEMSFKQIGERFQKTENWACVTYHRARKMIQKGMEACEDEK